MAVCILPHRAAAQMQGSASFSSAGTTAEAVTAFLHQLQKAVQADERKTVAALVTYPLQAWNGKRTVAVRDRRELLAQYPAVFRGDLRGCTESLKWTAEDAENAEDTEVWPFFSSAFSASSVFFAVSCTDFRYIL